MTPPLARRHEAEEYRDVLEACHRLGIDPPTDVVTTRAWLTIARRLDSLEEAIEDLDRRLARREAAWLEGRL